jgi:hypothetical protein
MHCTRFRPNLERSAWHWHRHQERATFKSSLALLERDQPRHGGAGITAVDSSVGKVLLTKMDSTDACVCL